MNYFELFGLPVSVQVDKKGLARKYFELQKKYHPDFFTQAEEEVQQDALEKSSLINKALKVFQSPVETMQYVLQLKGMLATDEKYQLPPAFLMEMMELNEKLVEQSPTEFRKELGEIEAELFSGIGPIVENYDDSTISPRELLLLKDYYYKKKYLDRILDRLDD